MEDKKEPMYITVRVFLERLLIQQRRHVIGDSVHDLTEHVVRVIKEQPEAKPKND